MYIQSSFVLYFHVDRIYTNAICILSKPIPILPILVRDTKCWLRKKPVDYVINMILYIFVHVVSLRFVIGDNHHTNLHVSVFPIKQNFRKLNKPDK